VQRPIPIWIGAVASSAVRQAPRIADGYIPIGAFDGEIPRQISLFREELAKHNRERTAVGLEGWIHLDRRKRDSWDREVAFWLDHRATHLTLLTEKLGYSSLEEHLDVLAEGLEMVGNHFL
jgi:alkanesulfonate monooxygenase SsuD/methylene tetrahydromethanopterin reductase-like flavin-dependent oxidoreductase (luciferase family)